MLRELERKDFIVHSPCKGIYYIEEKVYFPTQIVVSRELEGEQHVWLQALTKKMDKESAKRLLLQAQNNKMPGDQRLADAVLAVSVRANSDLFGKVVVSSNL